MANGAGAALFSLVDIDNGSATLRWEIVHEWRTMTSEALEEYLEDVLLSREGIELNLSVTISDQFSRLPATDGASIGFLSEAQEEQSPDLAVINATRERLAASARGNGPVPGPDTRNEKPPSTEGGRFLG